MSSKRSWKIAEAFARGQQVLRQEGPRDLWFKVWGELGYRRLNLFESHFAAAQTPPEVQPQPECRSDYVVYWGSCVLLAWMKDKKRAAGEMEGIEAVVKLLDANAQSGR
ncbi:MAG: hypothetical protein O2968_18705 [Acidobacteria bacterium]|nr:hypothetical protein [Acidobacteriota bacterium]